MRIIIALLVVAVVFLVRLDLRSRRGGDPLLAPMPMPHLICLEGQAWKVEGQPQKSVIFCRAVGVVDPYEFTVIGEKIDHTRPVVSVR